MIICPKCQGTVLIKNDGAYICQGCGETLLNENGVIYFHPEERDSNEGMEAVILDDLVQFEEKHFWMKARRSYLGWIFSRFVKPEAAIIEIGAGTGYVARYLIDRGYRDYAIGDIHKKGLALAGAHDYKHKYQFNLLRTVFAGHFDVVGMFDVLEHLDDAGAAVKNVRKMLRKGGRAIVTVPAHKWLWSKQDAIAYHRRRYEVEELKELFTAHGFKVLKASGFFLSLIPFMYLRKMINRDDGKLSARDYQDRFKINRVINLMLELMLRLEMVVGKNLSSRYGGSMILVAEKTED